MKNIAVFVLLVLACFSGFAVNLVSMNRKQVEQAFVNKTAVSTPTDNLNGHTIDNTFSMFLDGHGKIWGKMAHKPANQPQMDEGVYTIKRDSTFYITWQH